MAEQAPIPVSTCNRFVGGTLLTYEVTDAQALLLVHPSMLPKPSPRCKAAWREGDNLIRSYRMPDGRVRLTISERLVRQRDNRFQRLVAAVTTLSSNTTSITEAAHV